MSNPLNRKGLSHSDCGKLGAIASKAKIEEMKQKRIEEYNSNPNRCTFCNVVLIYEKRHCKFCSHTCSATFNNQGVCRHGTPREFNYCLACNSKLYGKQYKYCSIKCQCKFVYQQRLAAAKKDGNWWDGWNHAGDIRRELIKERGVRCEICGATEWMGQPIPIVMDHKDGNSDNWRDDNLRLICCNCDAQTPTYKSKNKGHGRYKRRQRFKEGKSY